MPSSVRWVQGNPQRFITTPARVIKDIYRPRFYKRMESVLAAAVKDYRQFTSERGTPNSGHDGRIDSGAMLNAVTYRVEQVSGQIIGDFGFLSEQQFYYFLQTDEGFTHYLSGAFIEPTFAMRDAALIAFQKLIERRA